MNFLAHAVLAGSQRQVVAGSLMGDFVKGVLYAGDYPDDVLFGIKLHRRIDAFSNQDPDLKISAARLPVALRRIAPPCIDILADHLLARAAQTEPHKWLPHLTPVDSKPAPTSLTDYETNLHQILHTAQHWLSADAKRFFNHAEASQLFSNYADFERAAKGIGYVCKRLGQPEAATQIIAAMVNQHAELQADFDRYWPQLAGEAKRFLQDFASRQDTV